jgi:hypothetical protein
MSTRKQVWQYHCDFCKKKMYSSSAMSKHERHCTLNPDRECRMCLISERIQQPIPELIKLLPNPADYKNVINNGVILISDLSIYDPEEYPGYDDAIAAALIRLRGETSNCPACILSAIRQSKVFVHSVPFDYKAELKRFWNDHNEAHCDDLNRPYEIFDMDIY